MGQVLALSWEAEVVKAGLKVPEQYKGKQLSTEQVARLGELKAKSVTSKITQEELERALKGRSRSSRSRSRSRNHKEEKSSSSSSATTTTVTTSAPTSTTVTTPGTRIVKRIEKKLVFDAVAEQKLKEESERIHREAVDAWKAQQEAQTLWERTQFEAQLLLRQQQELEERKAQLELSKKYVEVEVEVEVPEELAVTKTVETRQVNAAAATSAPRRESYSSYSSWSESGSEEEQEEEIEVVKPTTVTRKEKQVTRKMMLVEYESSEESGHDEDEWVEEEQTIPVERVQRVQRFRKRVVYEAVDYDEHKEAELRRRYEEAERNAMVALKVQQAAQKAFETAQAEATAALYLHKEATERAEKKAAVCVKMQQDAAKAYEKAQSEAFQAMLHQKDAIEGATRHMLTRKVVEIEIEEPFSENEIRTTVERIRTGIPKRRKEQKQEDEEGPIVKIRKARSHKKLINAELPTGEEKQERARSRSRSRVRRIHHFGGDVATGPSSSSSTTTTVTSLRNNPIVIESNDIVPSTGSFFLRKGIVDNEGPSSYSASSYSSSSSGLSFSVGGHTVSLK